ncbi:MAG: tetratricopeptide repeat protein [Arenicellales bacterium]
MGRTQDRSSPAREASRQKPGKAEVDALISAFRSGRYEDSLTGARRFTEQWPEVGFGWMMSAASLHALGRLEEAAEDYRQALELEPKNAEAHNNLGNILRDLGRYVDSTESHRQAIALRPAFVEAHFNLGLTLSALEDYRGAEAAFRTVLRMRPDIADAHNHLGNLYKGQGRLEKAVDAYRQALKLAPRFAEVHSNLGSTLAAQGAYEAAEASYRRALEIKPTAADILSNLGTFLMGRGRFEEAEECYRSAVRQRPGTADLHNHLGIALRGQGRFTEACAEFSRAIELKPGAASIHHNMGDALMDLGRLREAEEHHRQAVRLAPDSVSAHRNLGVALAVLGRPEDALESYRQALRRGPEEAELYYRLAEVKRFVPGDPDLGAVEELLDRGDTSDDDRVYLHYAAGKAYADIGSDFDRSFEHYAAGARTRRSQLRYDVSGDEDELERIARVFTSELIARISTLGYAGDAPMPVLVVGMPRSGTTLVENILASHPAVHGAGERTDLDRLAASIGRSLASTYPGWVGEISDTDWKELGQGYAARLAETSPSARCIIDKMPNNFRHVGLVAGMLRNVRVIHVRRDPRDTCVSCFTHLFEGGQYFSYDLEELGRFYSAYSLLMSHWRDVLPDSVLLEVRYEDMVADPETWMRRLIAHCGLEWAPAVLDFHASERAIPTASLVQVRQPIYRGAIGRWKVYARHLAPLIRALGPVRSTSAIMAGRGES